MVLRPAELRSCLIESAHLVLGRPLFQPLMFGLKSYRLFVEGGRMACGGDVRTSVVVGEMMQLVAWFVHGCFGC